MIIYPDTFKMLINLSNHPSNKWDNKQKQNAVELYTSIYDISFPNINPDWDTNKIKDLTKTYYNKIMSIFDNLLLDVNLLKNETNAVHIMGEFTFVFNLITLLKSSGITCVASTTNRSVKEDKNGNKTVLFSFVKFREY